MQKLLLTGGGSAGHVVPNLALLPDFSEYFEVCYLGTDGIERTLAEQAGLPFYTVPAPKLVRGSVLKNLALPFRLTHSVRQARKALREIAPDVLFSKGGYAALPAVLAAKRLGIPVFAHESDLTPGLANRLSARRCAAVFTSFPETAEKFRNGVYTGAPVRASLFAGDRGQALARYGFRGEKPVLLVFGGGSGSAALNAAVRGAVFALSDAFDILHLCGKGNAVPAQIGGYVQREYEEDMAAAYAAADLVAARAGSGTVFELLALKKPALLVPLENRRSRGDQVQNAQYFEERGLCRVLREGNLSPRTFEEAVCALAKDEALRRRLAAAPFRRGNRAIAAAVAAAVHAE